MTKRLTHHLLLLCAVASATAAWGFPQPDTDWRGQWIGVVGGDKPNSWIAFRKRFTLDEPPQEFIARIACDSKYWLWINGKPVVFEGQLKRGPTPRDTYFDRVDLSENLKAGENSISLLVWHFGKHGFSHNSSGRASLLFDAVVDGEPLVSDGSWKAKVHPAFGTTNPPLDNVRQPESNISFDARHDIGPWFEPAYDDTAWGPAKVFGEPPLSPWGELYERPIPAWKDSGLKNYAGGLPLPVTSAGQEIVCPLPYNAQVTPYLKVEATAGKVIGIHTDVYHRYGQTPGVGTHRHEYITRDGVQEWELPAWINGHAVHYDVPEGVRVLDLMYRETGYDTDRVGSFNCDDSRLNQLWEESARTLYVTMRDTYMDCPDRERAQWWGDAVNELGEAFYAFEHERAPLLTKKAIYELVRWQRDDKTLYSPVPSGVRRDGLLYPLDGSWDQELPRQMLASIGWYGFWTYYWNTGDEQTIIDAYPAVKRYLSLWELDAEGLVAHRTGGWDWTDWGEHSDARVIEHAWVYLALKAAARMAELADVEEDIAGYELMMATIRDRFNETYWRGSEYRDPGHSGPTDDRANAMAVVSGLASPEKFPAIAEVLRRERHASPYMEKYVLEAMILMGRPNLAFDRMVERYDYMLNDDITTLWEFFDPISVPGVGPMGRGTYNHAWSGGPLTILSQHVAGVAPTAPGFREFEVAPTPGRLEWIESVTPTRAGPIEVRIDRLRESGWRVTVASPPEYDGVVRLPMQGTPTTSVVKHKDTIVWKSGSPVPGSHGVRFVEQADECLAFAIPAGGATLSIQTPSAHSEEAASPTGDPNRLAPAERRLGFRSLFDGVSTEGWVHNGNWRVDEGALHRESNGGFLTYGPSPLPENFELRFQWKVADGSNSGIYYRPGQCEYQVLDNDVHPDGQNPRTSAAALYFGVAPSHDATRPAGAWNDGRIVCLGTVVQHWLNGTKVVDVDYDDPRWRDDLARLARLGGDLSARGSHLALQDHNDPVWFRALRLRVLPTDTQIDRTAVTPAEIPPAAIAREKQILSTRQ